MEGDEEVGVEGASATLEWRGRGPDGGKGGGSGLSAVWRQRGRPVGAEPRGWGASLTCPPAGRSAQAGRRREGRVPKSQFPRQR